MHPIDRLTLDEAEERAAAVSDIAYEIHLDLEAGAKSFRTDTTISFTHDGGDTFVEWVGGAIEVMVVNGVEVESLWDGARIALSASLLSKRNRIRLVTERPFDHTGEGFHRFVDPADGAEYLYTQFEPYSAHRVFPCFDQPDLKATYLVSVTAPANWAVISASIAEGPEPADGDRQTWRFARTAPFSTYLLAVCAGEYVGVRAEHGEIALGLWTRASLAEHLDAEPLFSLTRSGIDFYTKLFDQPYPFGKYDQVFVPEFNWGGMENVGCVTYTDSVVFREPPTSDQITRRAEYFMHELAHMWFGDLVTLQWWNDLWLNESFASYAAYLALDAIGGHPGIWQDFNYRMKLWAYREDQRPTTHRIADDVASTDETFLNFDGITYGKGAATLKQLVAAIGPDAFRDGMRLYFRRYRFGNASLADFLAALQEGSGVDLVRWAARWLRTPSLNTIAAEWTTDGSRLTGLRLSQEAPDDHPTLRPHALEVALLGDGGSIDVVLPVTFDGARVTVDGADGVTAPAFVFPNHGDHGYAKIRLDAASTSWARRSLERVEDPLLRQQVWAALWDMVRDRALVSTDYLALVRDRLQTERSVPMVQMVNATVAGAVGRYLPDDRIEREATDFVSAGMVAIDGAPEGDLRVLWARAVVSLAEGPESAITAAGLIDRPPPGLLVDQDMRWSVALRWVALGLEGADDRVAAEQQRDPTDRAARMLTAVEAAKPDAAAKEEVWERIHSGGYQSLHMEASAARGFWWRRQRALVEPYVERFFALLPGVFAEREAEAARAYFRSMFPGQRVDSDTRRLIAETLDLPEVGPMLRRMLIEADDDLARALACRALVLKSEPPTTAGGEPERKPRQSEV